MKWTAVCLVAAAMLGCLCDAQYYGRQEPSDPNRFQKPRHDSKQTQDPTQFKQTFETPLTWTYPADPQPEPQPEVPYELRYPVAASTVAVECREDMAHVEVHKDFFGVGKLISANDLTLGTCAAVGEDNAALVLIFESDLQGCGSELRMTAESLIYTFVLNYEPRPVGDVPVIRASSVAVTVECHYPRKQNVSSLAINPTWIPFAATKVSQELLYFTLKLMTDDWQFERPIYQYFLGDMIHIEATVKQYFHVPLRVYVDSCVATTSADTSSNPRYRFLENFGCMIDAKVTGSSSQFMPRTADDKLQFLVEAFRFQNTESGVLYITCHLKATSTAYPNDEEHRACSYIEGWKEASGSHGVCGSCDSSSGGYSSNTGSSSGSSYGSTGSSSGSSYGSTGSSSGSRFGTPGSTGSSSGSRFGTPGSTGSGSGGYTDRYGNKRERSSRDVSKKGQQQVVEWEGDVTMGPISIGEKMVE